MVVLGNQSTRMYERWLKRSQSNCAGRPVALFCFCPPASLKKMIAVAPLGKKVAVTAPPPQPEMKMFVSVASRICSCSDMSFKTTVFTSTFSSFNSCSKSLRCSVKSKFRIGLEEDLMEMTIRNGFDPRVNESVGIPKLFKQKFRNFQSRPPRPWLCVD